MSHESETSPTYRGRYAPSPTGRLHLGNLRTALLAWLHARLSKGRFILRIDDLDTPRNKPGSIEEIIADLHWLGLDWDEGPDIGGTSGPYLQSERLDHYERFFDKLKTADLVFPCICSRKDVQLAQSAPNAGQIDPIYPGTCRPPEGLSQQAAANRKPVSWRFLTRNITITSQAGLSESTTVELDRTVGDFVIKRKDGLYAYQFATVVDDGLMGISDIVRGSDLGDSMPRQLALFDALEFPRPRFLHVPLMHDSLGRRMAKRDGSDSLETWKSRDRAPDQLIGELASSCGLMETVRPISCQELLERLSPEDLLRSMSAA
ncbi:MAG: tRNA glutamyl-Q(34) synthetase GluQRS [Gammaproteobacteria bacterium]|nr:tRNA glutamyl-Q(34) synthetase GluQRS [Gammaproteobacteria bacterium]